MSLEPWAQSGRHTVTIVGPSAGLVRVGQGLVGLLDWRGRINTTPAPVTMSDRVSPVISTTATGPELAANPSCGWNVQAPSPSAIGP